MQEVIQEGKTRDEALAAALEKLGATEDQVVVEELEGQRDRFFGLLLSKNTRLKVSLKREEAPAPSGSALADDVFVSGSSPADIPAPVIKDPADFSEEERVVFDFIQTVLGKMDIDVHADVARNGDEISVYLDGEDAGMVIGKFGQTLDSMQYLSNVILGKISKENLKVVVNVGDYRARREESLSRMARAMAGKVIKTRKSITLAPMSPQDRRIIHIALSNYRNVATGSEGVGPNRRIVISYKK